MNCAPGKHILQSGAHISNYKDVHSDVHTLRIEQGGLGVKCYALFKELLMYC